jgi:hypothetical protein
MQMRVTPEAPVPKFGANRAWSHLPVLRAAFGFASLLYLFCLTER